jgi:hypothetical protein
VLGTTSQTQPDFLTDSTGKIIPAAAISSSSVRGSLVPAAVTVKGVEGQSTGPVTLATFTGAGPVSDYSATVNWGDGTSSPSTITSSNGVFRVTASHTYAEESGPDHPGSQPYKISVKVNHKSSTAQVFTTTATISDPAVALSAAGISTHTIEGASTGSLTLAKFTDPGGPDATGNYSATIAWGDGTTTAASISLSGNVFTVTSTGHTYGDEGTYSPVVTVRHDLSRQQVVKDTNLITVADAKLTAAGTTLSGAEGRSVSGTVATFTDANLIATPGDFAASINWGDGQTTTGTVFRDSAGHFHVAGSHAYVEQSFGYTVKVTIKDGVSSAQATGLAKIADSPLDTPVGLTLSVQNNVTFTDLKLGSFRDQDSLNTLGSDYNGTIDWGDGSARTTARVISNGSTFNVGSFWNVLGTHKYAKAGHFNVTINLKDGNSPLVIAALVKVM